MLVLTRKKNQSVMFGDEIEVQVLEIKGEQVRLGIQAPAHVRILRKELYLPIQKENQAAAESLGSSLDLKKIKREEETDI